MMTSIFVLFAGLAAASPERWPVEKIVTTALSRSGELRALEKDTERAGALADQAGRWDNPDLSLSYGPTTQGGERGHTLEAAVRQPVPLFGRKSLAATAARHRVEAAGLETLTGRMLVRATVTTLAYRLAAVAEESSHTAHRRASIQAVVKFLSTRPQVTPNQLVEKSLIESRVREIEDDLIGVEAERARLWSALNVYLGLDTPVEPAIDWSKMPALPEREALWAQVAERNPELRLRSTLVASAVTEERLARAKAYPDVRLGASYAEENAEFPQRTYLGTLELSLPLLDRGQDTRRAAKAEREAETLRLEHTRRELTARFAQAWTTVEQARKRVALYTDGLPKRSEAEMERGERGWRRGQVATPAFLELEHQTHAQALRYYSARVEYVQAWQTLMQMAGEAP